MQANTDLQDYGHSSSDESTPAGERAQTPISEEAGWLVFFKRINFFKKLSIFLPRRDHEAKHRDYRLFLLAIAFTIYRIGSMYMNDVSVISLRFMCNLSMPSSFASLNASSSC